MPHSGRGTSAAETQRAPANPKPLWRSSVRVLEAIRPASQDFAFCCDDRGNVELDALGDKARLDYLFARALVGRNFARPAIVRTL